MSRVYNFSAGPAVLPEEVLKEAGYSEEELQAMLEAGDISEAVITVK